MNDKYYTPTVQEIIEHVINGETIYAVVVRQDPQDPNSTPIETGELLTCKQIDDVFNLGKFLDSNCSTSYGDILDLNEKLYKIKYLDKKDIESFKFTFSKTGPFGDWNYELKTKDGINHFSFYYLNFCQGQMKIEVRREYGYDNEKYTLYQGRVKNKHELKTVLKNLNII